MVPPIAKARGFWHDSRPMKHALAAVLATLSLAAPALADGALVPATEALPELRAAYGKQVDVQFSDSFATGRLPKPDIDGVTVYGLQPDSLCLEARDKGLSTDAPGLAAFAAPDGGMGVCVPLADVSIRVAKHEPVDGAAPVPFYSTDPTACSWEWRQGRDLGLWTESCKFSTGLWRVSYDEASDSFTLNVDGKPYTMVLQQFRDPGGPAALVATLKKQDLVFDKDECQMVQVSDQPAPQGWTAWQVVPTGALKEAFDKEVQEQIPEPPCGKLGFTVDSVGFFMVKDGVPDRVLYANLGQDGTMVDLASIRFK
jgi:hypothetical protein